MSDEINNQTNQIFIWQQQIDQIKSDPTPDPAELARLGDQLRALLQNSALSPADAELAHKLLSRLKPQSPETSDNIHKAVANPLRASFSSDKYIKSEGLVVHALQGSNLQQLTKIRTRLGVRVHEELLKSVEVARITASPPPKLVLINTVSAGKDTQSVANNDQSSKYLAGGIVHYSTPANSESYLHQDPAQAVSSVFEFWEKQGIHDFTMVAAGDGYASGEHAGEFHIYAGTRDQVVSEQFTAQVDQADQEDRRKALQEFASIVTLSQILRLSGMEEEKIAETVETLKAQPAETGDALLVRAEEIEKFNASVWNDLKAVLDQITDTDPKMKLSIGESFTSGILANLMTSLDGASKILDMSLNWYDPRLKQYVGVPEENVQENLIAEPVTIGIAAEGLLSKAPETTGITVGTTGWANYWVKGEPDYFSIGVAYRTPGSEKAKVSAVKVEVTSSKDAPRSKGRRQLTRHLGATASLHLLAKVLEEKYPQDERLTAIADRTLSMIQNHGTLTEKNP